MSKVSFVSGMKLKNQWANDLTQKSVFFTLQYATAFIGAVAAVLVTVAARYYFGRKKSPVTLVGKLLKFPTFRMTFWILNHLWLSFRSWPKVSSEVDQKGSGEPRYKTFQVWVAVARPCPRSPCWTTHLPFSQNRWFSNCETIYSNKFWRRQGICWAHRQGRRFDIRFLLCLRYSICVYR